MNKVFCFLRLINKIKFVILFLTISIFCFTVFSISPMSGFKDKTDKNIISLYSKKRLEYFSLINKYLNNEQNQKTLLYIGSAGDISSALLISDCDKFIFVDGLPFKDFIEEMDGKTLLKAKEIYFEDKQKGWSKSEILDFDIRAAEYPLLWELSKLNALVSKNEYIEELGAYEIKFKIPNDKNEKTIYFFTIHDANHDDSYSLKLISMIEDGIDVFMLKAFQPKSLPLSITSTIIASLSSKGRIVCETYHLPFFTQFYDLVMEFDPKIEQFEVENNLNLGYEGHTTVFFKKNTNSFFISHDFLKYSA